MPDGDLHEQIARLEGEIEDLALGAERCRRISLVARVAIAVGAIWMLAIVIGAARLDPAAAVGVTASIIGGIVLFGSNAGTARETAARLEAAETRRTDLISRIEFGASPVAGTIEMQARLHGEQASLS